MGPRLLLLFPFLAALDDTSGGSGGMSSHVTSRLAKYAPWLLLLAAGAATVPLVWAEEN